MPDDPAGKLGQTGPANRYAAVSIIHNYLSLNYLTQTKSFPGQRKWLAAGAFVTEIVHARTRFGTGERGTPRSAFIALY